MQEIDAITVKRATKGDRRAFKALYDWYAPFLWRVLFPMAKRDMTTACDLVQETFIKVYCSLHQFKGESALSTWLYRIAYTTAMAYARKPRNRYWFQPCTDSIRATDHTDGYDNRQLADRILASLCADDRFLLVAREIDNIPFDDLAAITGQNAGALRTRLHRLKETIRKSYPQEQLAMSEV
ncbi:MAG: sigma-70 family RNA polymerase sigma factor [Chitinispirillaceae bacterium]|nr:sigma-70 family RNA polymerase sigma factor [Chitinispirillaceae bacterium]